MTDHITETENDRFGALRWPAEETATDFGDALRLYRLAGDRVRYVDDQASWLLWDGSRWRPSTVVQVLTLTEELVSDVRLQAEVEGQPTEDEEGNRVGTDWRRHAAKLEAIAKRRAVVDSLATLPAARVRSDDLDRDPNLLVVENGTVELDSGTLRDSRPEDLCTRMCTAPFDPDAHSELLDDFAVRFIPRPEHRRFLFKALGACLLGGNPWRQLLIIKGATTSGKSTLAEGIAAALGDYAVPVNVSVFRGAHDDKPRPDLMAALDARLVYASEAAATWELHTDQIKRMTGGDPLPMRGMRSNVMVGRIPSFTPLIVTNQMPHIKGADKAVRRRLLVLPMTRSLAHQDEDPTFKARFAEDPDTRAALLRLLVAGCALALKEQLDDVPPEFDEATAEAYDQLDHVADFVGWAKETGQLEDAEPGFPVAHCWKAGDLHMLYLTWISLHGDHEDRRTSLNMRRFGERLRDMGWEVKKVMGTRWVGKRRPDATSQVAHDEAGQR